MAHDLAVAAQLTHKRSAHEHSELINGVLLVYHWIFF